MYFFAIAEKIQDYLQYLYRGTLFWSMQKGITCKSQLVYYDPQTHSSANRPHPDTGHLTFSLSTVALASTQSCSAAGRAGSWSPSLV